MQGPMIDPNVSYALVAQSEVPLIHFATAAVSVLVFSYNYFWILLEVKVRFSAPQVDSTAAEYFSCRRKLYQYCYRADAIYANMVEDVGKYSTVPPEPKPLDTLNLAAHFGPKGKDLS